MHAFNERLRREVVRPPLKFLDHETFDVVIIGGGINGAAAAQEIIGQGHSVLLVDKGDFGSGTSSRSSRLLHCGLRYLAPGRSIWDFVVHPTRFMTAMKMAKQAMEARAEFVETSSLRTRPLQFAFPIYQEGPYRAWQVDIAFLILKLLGPRNPPLDYHRISGAEARNMPLMNELRDLDRIHSVAVYREYEFDWPERVCMDCILDAERMGAVVRNYTLATLGRRRDGGVWPVVLRDQLDGATVEVSASIVLNLAGIWIDEVNATPEPNAKRRVLGTKGTHIVVKLPNSCAGYGVATLNSKREPFYCIPWHDLHYFGPTETLYEGNKEDIHVTNEEQAWLLKEANRLMPGIGLSEKEVRLTWAGVRPLTYDKAVPFGNRSRQLHDLTEDGMPNVLAMTAGPVLSHRSAGRLLAKAVAKRLRPQHRRQRPDYAPKQPPASDSSPALVSGLSTRLSDLQHGIQKEHAVTLMDLLFRRTGLGWRHQFSEAEIDQAASVLATERGLSSAEKWREIEAFKIECERLFGRRSSQDSFTSTIAGKDGDDSG
ncbi:glycerol-3-phosphate dehydrogenase [Paraburkholderia sp. BL23I1N1]|uniref:D-erythritol 1-phosphate dehydrogenase n=1 Tax=Paraburkholderia rhynchosiae TaxID=487049 RepID=A0A6J5AQC8_9BURK|nr:glycerol-3-phosphate dehydrogenase [Paraburkholderia sp. BL27I4N3]RKE35581.1 glycerol-3-phosphate dehydrogenase [Paraburkholderia sp. BL23I1N1]CAB3669932.1 D-erythritol 1-phosphate dehydrogenase [Paraburkholderia rhynchosiae]